MAKFFSFSLFIVPHVVQHPVHIYLRMGGQTIVHESGRGAYGTCLMKDGSESEEWAFYRSWYPRMD